MSGHNSKCFLEILHCSGCQAHRITSKRDYCTFGSLCLAGHVLLETILMVTIIALMSQKSYKPDNKNKLTEKVGIA